MTGKKVFAHILPHRVAGSKHFIGYRKKHRFSATSRKIIFLRKNKKR